MLLTFLKKALITATVSNRLRNKDLPDAKAAAKCVSLRSDSAEKQTFQQPGYVVITNSTPAQTLPHATPRIEPSHVAFVDSLRGLAFLLVLLLHVSQQVPSLPDRLRRVTDDRQAGVQLFFLVSAFTLLTSLSQRSKRESRPIQNFLVRRFFRIAPLFWAALVFSITVGNLADTGRRSAFQIEISY